MAVIRTNDYPGPPWFHVNGHCETVFSAFGGPAVPFRRERLELDDGDFLDLDWLQAARPARSLIILTHGLEGNSQRRYMRSAAHYFHQRGWDALSWNCRSCSGEMNRLLRLYHHGEIEDIHRVTTHALNQFDYDRVVLIGFSMGGAMTSKYLSVHSDTLSDAVIGGIAFCAPFDLGASVDALELPGNGLYKKRFMRQLGDKIRIKNKRFPGLFDISKLDKVTQWREFDEWFTAPLVGVNSAKEFYELASAKHFLHKLTRPVLAISAMNDPIITDACLPYEESKGHAYFKLELTPRGGHVGYSLRKQKHNWMDIRAWEEVQKWEKLGNWGLGD